MTKVKQMRLQKQQHQQQLAQQQLLKQQQEEERLKQGQAQVLAKEFAEPLVSSGFDWTEVRKRYGQDFDIHDFASRVAWNLGCDLRVAVMVPTFASDLEYILGDIRTKKKKQSKMPRDLKDGAPPLIDYDRKKARLLSMGNLLNAYMHGGLSLAHSRRVHQRLVFAMFWSCAFGSVLGMALTSLVQ